MIKPPKIREQMVRLKTRKFTVRFWFSSPVNIEGKVGDVLTKLQSELDYALSDYALSGDTTTVADFIASKLPDETPLAAMEVLLNSNHSGTVDYFEWP